MKKVFLFAIIMLLVFHCKAQQNKGITVFGTIINGDTVALSYLEPVIIRSYITPLTKEEEKKYSKLIRDTKKTYPIAKQAQQLLDSYSTMLDHAQNNSQKDKIKQQAYYDIKNKFYQKARRLKKDQAKLLSKLIYRQTGQSSYSLIKEFGGGMKATMARATSKAMGIDLRETFDAQNNEQDRIIERIIFCIESGTIK